MFFEEKKNRIVFVFAFRIVQLQNLLHESTKDVIESKFDLRNAEKQWLTEKDQLLEQLDQTAAHEQRKDDEILFLNASHQNANSSSTASILLQENAFFEEERKKYEEEIQQLEQQHVQTHKLAEMYRNQVIGLEEQLCKIREEGDVTREIYKVKTNKTFLFHRKNRHFSFRLGSIRENESSFNFVKRSF